MAGHPEQVIGDLRVMLARTEDERSSRFDGVVGKMVQRQAGQKRTEQVRAAVAPPRMHLISSGGQPGVCVHGSATLCESARRTETGSLGTPGQAYEAAGGGQALAGGAAAAHGGYGE